MDDSSNKEDDRLEKLIERGGDIGELIRYSHERGWIGGDDHDSIQDSLEQGPAEDGLARAVLSLAEKLSEQDREIKDLFRLAHTDSLTELYNRLGMERIIEKRNSKDDYSFIYFDIDHFKGFNDTYGHKTGDLVLRYVAKAANESVRSGDIGRPGGEEFIVMLKNSDTDGAYVVADRIRKRIEKTVACRVIEHLEGTGDYKTASMLGQETVTASFGVASSEEASSPIKVIELADMRMYHAKNSMGRNAVCKCAGGEDV